MKKIREEHFKCIKEDNSEEEYNKQWERSAIIFEQFYEYLKNKGLKESTAGKRRMMLAMATGTGKTYTIVSQIYRLMKSGLAKRILFLVDRRALAAQAVQAFATFDAEPGKKFDQI